MRTALLFTLKMLIATLIILAFTASFASANDTVVISGGSKGGSYDRWANNVGAILRGLGYKAEVKRSRGSGTNVERVVAGEAHVGFTQGDVLMAKGGQGVEILAELGEECVFLVGNKDGRVTDEDDLQSTEEPVLKIGVGKAGSGSQITWQYMVQLEDGYGASAAQFQGGARSLAAVASGQLDAAMFVTSPSRLDHKLIQAVNGNDKLMFLDVNDSDLNDKLPNGSPVYLFKDIDTKAGWGGGIETICTPVLVIANPDVDEDLLDDLAGQLLSNKAAVLQ